MCGQVRRKLHAAWVRARRTGAGPALVIPGRCCLLELECSPGVRPRKPWTAWALLNRVTSSIAATKRMLVTGPIPGTGACPAPRGPRARDSVLGQRSQRLPRRSRARPDLEAGASDNLRAPTWRSSPRARSARLQRERKLGIFSHQDRLQHAAWLSPCCAPRARYSLRHPYRRSH